MAATAEVLAALKTQIEGSADLTDIEAVLYDEREAVDKFPVLMIELTEEQEDERNYKQNEVYIVVSILCVIRDDDPARQVVTVLSPLANSLKKALYEDPTLGGKVIHTAVKTTRYPRKEGQFRGFEMEIEIRNRQTVDVRT